MQINELVIVAVALRNQSTALGARSALYTYYGTSICLSPFQRWSFSLALLADDKFVYAYSWLIG
jgi:hypothetical protein